MPVDPSSSAKVPANGMTLDALRERLLGDVARQRLAMRMAMGGDGVEGGVMGADELRRRVLASGAEHQEGGAAATEEASVGADRVYGGHAM